jgi:hypothetical protein
MIVNLSKVLFGFTILLALFVLTIFIGELLAGYDKGSWNITEWLINYESGFIRRGLSGQLIFNAYRYLNINPYNLIIGTCVVFYISLCIIITRAAYLKNFPIILLPATYILGGPIVNDFWVRKDVFLMLCFIAALNTLKSGVTVKRFFLVNFTCCIALLCHESFGFWALFALIFAHFIQTVNSSPAIKRLGRSIAVFIPSIAIFLLCLYYKGNAEQANSIWNSWQNIRFPYNSSLNSMPPGAIFPLAWDLLTGITYYSNLIFTYSYGIYVPLGLTAGIISVYLIVAYSPLIGGFLPAVYSKGIPEFKDLLFKRRVLSIWLLIQLCLIVPLFIVGIDYGRWIFLWVTSSVCLYLFLPVNAHQNLLKLVNYGAYNDLAKVFTIEKFLLSGEISIPGYRFQFKQGVKVLYVAAFFFIGVSVLSWDLRTFFLSSPLGIVRQFFHFIYYGSLFEMYG